MKSSRWLLYTNDVDGSVVTSFTNECNQLCKDLVKNDGRTNTVNEFRKNYL